MTPLRPLRAKFLRVMLGILVPMILATLSCVAFLQVRVMRESARDDERMIRESVAARGRVLTAGHALALRGMVVDNGFSAVSELVQHAVRTDPDLVYGVFLSVDDRAWVYVAPDGTGEPALADDPQKWRELGLTPAMLNARRPAERTVRIFERDVLEFAAPVYDGGELLGTVRYGFSTQRTQRALEAARSRAEQSLATTLLIVAFIAALSVSLGVVLVGRAARQISQPVGALVEAANTIAEGRRDVRVHVASGDELELLARAFNHMLEVNQRAFEQLEETTERALEASRVKSEFLANMSHEIRTPMNGVMGIASLMLQMPLDRKMRRYVETINASSTALLTIINDVLDFSKLESGKYVLQSVPFEPRLVVQEVAELLASRASEKGLELVYRVDREVPAQVSGDPDRFRQVLNNLVGNAVKFTERGDVFIEVSCDSGVAGDPTLRVSVTDTGIGIAEKDVATIFDAFAQVDGSLVRKYGGTGLGLAISKRLVEAMGGTLGVWSRPGMGSQFWFTVKGAGQRDEAQPSAPLSGGKVALVIEASHRWRDVIVEHMTSWGVEVESHPSVQTWLARVGDAVSTRHRYDVIVAGAPTGPADLEALVEVVDRSANPRNVPVIVLNHPGTDASFAEGEARVVAQLAKPLRMSDLYNSLQDAFAGKRASQRATNSVARVRTQEARRILVVDDNRVNQFVAVEQLAELGYAADVASDGAQAVDMVGRGDYALVLMDCQMPVMDGYSATREIRTREAGTDRHVTIVALTAHALAGERDRVLAAGMDDYLAKPLRANALEKMLARHLSASGPAAHAPLAVHPVPGAAPQNDTLQSEQGRPPPPLDASVVRSRSFLEICLREMPKQRDALVEALEAGDMVALRAGAHKLKGAALAATAEPLASLAEQLQHAAERNELELSVELVCQVQERFVAVEEALVAELAAMAS